MCCASSLAAKLTRCLAVFLAVCLPAGRTSTRPTHPHKGLPPAASCRSLPASCLPSCHRSLQYKDPRKGLIGAEGFGRLLEKAGRLVRPRRLESGACLPPCLQLAACRARCRRCPPLAGRDPQARSVGCPASLPTSSPPHLCLPRRLAATIPLAAVQDSLRSPIARAACVKREMGAADTGADGWVDWAEFSAWFP